jgi:hypothetical protein
MHKINISVKETFGIIGCAFMAHTQLDELDLDSTIGVSTKIRMELIGKITQLLIQYIHKGEDYVLELDVEEPEYRALLGLTSHGIHWFNKSLFDFDKETALGLLKRLESNNL